MWRRITISTLLIVLGLSALAVGLAAQKSTQDEPGQGLVVGQTYLFAISGGGDISGQVLAKPANGWVRVKMEADGRQSTPGCCGCADGGQAESQIKEGWINLRQVAVIATVDPAAKPKPVNNVPCI